MAAVLKIHSPLTGSPQRGHGRAAHVYGCRLPRHQQYGQVTSILSIGMSHIGYTFSVQQRQQLFQFHLFAPGAVQ